MKIPQAIVVLAVAIALGALWPWFAARNARANSVPPAPIQTDYLQRNALIAFYEAHARRDASDQITRRVLGGEYLQRFRETGDLNDVTRALAVASDSLRLQPQGNVQALGVIASCDIALHRFEAALGAQESAVEAEPFADNSRAQVASILMEMGRYDRATHILAPPLQT
ncbi:MAG: hypothetical protein WBW76_13775, partial [Candidatus Cybelea sp.]